ncbi:ATP-binding protein [Geopsychrobacter electrodiphilus]|uniref:ATP-binding protein n=1 Tax=Geopsychrobacter electrodiphilus TaxID=225196 RepID=UPI000375179C|nr:ATP-binding protein [Geopsychrobacter electrodiphilus]
MDSLAKRFFEVYPLDKLLQTIPTGLFMVNPDMSIVYWNVEAERITGFLATDVVGKHCSFLEGIPCGTKCGLFDPGIPKPLRGISCSIRHKDGRRIDLSKNLDLLYTEKGDLLGGIESFVDITQLKQLQQNLKAEVDERTVELGQEQRNLRAVLDGMLDLAYICTEDFEVSFMNRAMQELLGEARGRKCYEVMHGLPRVCDDCPLPLVKQGEIVRQERRLPMSNRTYEIIHSPLYQADGRVRKLGVCRDITERLQTEIRLKHANAELDAFVSTVSHDLRSPLTPLIGFSEFLIEQYGPNLDATAVSCLHEIESTGRRMQALLEDLLTLARVGEVSRPIKPVSINRVLEEVRQELAVQILRKKACIEIGELPEVRVPESLLVDLFRNLLRNALAYAVGQDPRIEIEGERLPGRIQVRVIDHGPGVVSEEQDLIFEPFQRGAEGIHAPGTGVGLATVRKIARLYRGKVHVEKTEGGGATFVVEFFDEPEA